MQKRRLILIPTLAVLAVLFAASIYFLRQDSIDRFNTPQRIEATEQLEKTTVVTGEELSRAMVAELGKSQSQRVSEELLIPWPDSGTFHLSLKTAI